MAGWGLPTVSSIPGLNRAFPPDSPDSPGSGFEFQHAQWSQLFDPGEGKHVTLRYGDTVSLLPEGSRGVMAYAGALDARPWVHLPPHYPRPIFLFCAPPCREEGSGETGLERLGWKCRDGGRCGC